MLSAFILVGQLAKNCFTIHRFVTNNKTGLGIGFRAPDHRLAEQEIYCPKKPK